MNNSKQRTLLNWNLLSLITSFRSSRAATQSQSAVGQAAIAASETSQHRNLVESGSPNSNEHAKRQTISYSAVPNWVTTFAFLLAIVSGTLWFVGKSQIDVQPLVSYTAELMSRQVPADLRIAPIESLRASQDSLPPAPDYSTPRSTPYSLPFSLLDILMGCTAFGVFVLILYGNKGVLLKPSGITFPESLYAGLLFRPERAWTDVQAVSLAGGADNGAPAEIAIYFKSGGAVKLNLSRMSTTDLETLLIAIEEFGNKCAIAPELIAMRHKLCKESKDDEKNKNITHTAMWQEELHAHFAATNFIPLPNGRVLQSGNYKVIMQLAAGGLSAIYLAERKNSVVVVKEAVIPPLADEGLRQKARELFQREAQILGKLDHPQIAKVLDHFVEDGRDYLILEYIPGRTLRDLVKKNGAQRAELVLDWAKQIASILDYLHSQDPPLVHRDLTPDNLMITAEGTIYLIDFGASNQFVGTATGTLIGKQLYIAPEQFRGKAEPASDIYAFGATLQFLLTAKEPTALATSHPKQLQPELDPRLDALVSKCTHLEASQRYSARELLYELNAVTQQRDLTPLTELESKSMPVEQEHAQHRHSTSEAEESVRINIRERVVKHL